MALIRNMSAIQMVNFIDQELLPQVRMEIKNWITPRKRQGGYFVTVRQIMCIVDFLGAVYCGYPYSERKNDKKAQKIATPSKAIKFMINFFEPKQSYNQNSVNILHNMYRNGLVHLYQPKILKYGSNGRLKWFFHKGKRHMDKISVDSNNGKVTFKNVDHLQVTTVDPKRRNYYFPISIYCLYEDFEQAVIKYRDKLASTKSLQRKWRTTVNAICKPQ